MEEKITLRCVRESGKLRIRFHSFTNAEGKEFTNVYSNDYNCQFPRDIREEGKFYEVGRDDIALVAGGGRQPFYRIKAGNIRVVDYDGSVTAAPSKKKKRTRKTKGSSVEDLEEPASSSITIPQQVFEVNECVICLEGTPTQIFIPCAHLCTCTGCYQSLMSSKPSCPLCRRTVTSSITK
eukprot:gene14910-16596_t